MLGYLKDPRGHRGHAGGRLGALGRPRASSTTAGALYFAGRLKNVIKRSGENISAEEVEAALDAHPDVAECAGRSGCPTGSAPRRSARSSWRGPARRSTRRRCVDALAGRLARWKLPRYIVVTDEPLPRLGNGKIDRVGARRLVEPGRGVGPEAAAAPP